MSQDDSHTVGVRQLRNQVAKVIRRAATGERVIITVDGSPVAQLGPLSPDHTGVTLWDLAMAGLVEPPRRHDHPPSPAPIAVPTELSADRLMIATRGR